MLGSLAIQQVRGMLVCLYSWYQFQSHQAAVLVKHKLQLSTHRVANVECPVQQGQPKVLFQKHVCCSTEFLTQPTRSKSFSKGVREGQMKGLFSMDSHWFDELYYYDLVSGEGWHWSVNIDSYDCWKGRGLCSDIFWVHHHTKMFCLVLVMVWPFNTTPRAKTKWHRCRIDSNHLPMT